MKCFWVPTSCPALSLSWVCWKDQNRVMGNRLCKETPLHAQEHLALVMHQGSCYPGPAHQDLSQLLFLTFPWLLPIHLSGFLPGPRMAGEKNRLQHASTFPFPFISFLQSPCNRTTSAKRIPLNIHWYTRSWTLEPYRPAFKFELYLLLAVLLMLLICSFLICKLRIINIRNWWIKIQLCKVILK